MLERVEGLKKLEVYAKDFLKEVYPKNKGAFIVGLSGELGSGKTSFVQCAARILGVVEQITSPTFVIEKIYPLKKYRFGKLIHIDAYRLKNSDELLTVGWRDVADDVKNLIFIEWPEHVEEALPKDIAKLLFTYVDETTRNIEQK